ncbi:MAG: DNA alkylation repair protein [Verrucomicrobiales bacterium]|nr:DNA alkylation repair protein [Verrucomicrobiales bacterium]
MHPLAKQLFLEMAMARNPAKAAPMQAYMKTDQAFYGIQAKERKAIFKRCAAEHRVDSMEDYQEIVRTLWGGEHREDMYQALEVAEYFKTFRTTDAWKMHCDLVHSAPHWDTLDWVAGKLISELVLLDRARFDPQLILWSKDSNRWVRRASLLAHLHHKEKTNRDLLGDTIRLLMPEKEPFIRKAIGWVLRDFANTDPLWVIEFARHHEENLSALSRREALKRLDHDDEL